MRSNHVHALRKLAVFLALSAGFVPAFANEISFEVGRDLRGFNTAFVSVKICEPGTATCRVIDKIKLDTGSTGLRISSEALSGLRLTPLKAKSGALLTTCAGMAGGVGYLGSLARADITLGDSTARSTTFQVVDYKVPAKGITCLPFPSDGRNGILGIGTLRMIENGSKVFECTKNRCIVHLPKDGERAENIVSHLDHDNNGFIVKTPALKGPCNNVTGQIVFGIGTRENNQPKAGISKCSVRSDGFLLVNYKGNSHYTMLDTGTFSTLLPFKQNEFSQCSGGGGYLCPSGKPKLDISIRGNDGLECASVDMPIRSYSSGRETQENGNWVLPQLSTVNPLLNDTLILGMPFFFGRDVYFVVAGRNSPLGAGPLVGF